jgi:2,3-bisphosphoglycerate-independent phosphoglycerate mutase
VHSSLEHLDALLLLLAAAGVPGERVFVHAIADGRDVAGDSSPRYLAWLDDELRRVAARANTTNSGGKFGRLVSISGRAWGKVSS